MSIGVDESEKPFFIANSLNVAPVRDLKYMKFTVEITLLYLVSLYLLASRPITIRLPYEPGMSSHCY